MPQDVLAAGVRERMGRDEPGEDSWEYTLGCLRSSGMLESALTESTANYSRNLQGIV